MKVTHDLSERGFNTKEIVLEEVIDLQRRITEDVLEARIRHVANVGDTLAHDFFINTCVGESCNQRVFTNVFQILNERSVPLLRLSLGSIVFNECCICSLYFNVDLLAAL